MYAQFYYVNALLCIHVWSFVSGTEFLQVVATDADISVDNSGVTYQIVGRVIHAVCILIRFCFPVSNTQNISKIFISSFSDGNTETTFQINATTGGISAVYTPFIATYTLTVQATDSGNPPLAKNVTVELTVDSSRYKIEKENTEKWK